MDVARIASLLTTTVLLVGLGVGRARITHRPVVPTTVQTLAIAAIAAAAGILIGRLVVV